ncbi:Outer membrane receptor proteins, mostly Fe transport [Lishizhenia tianjinensis]|uniref:Outer membrane receptor proteins, mostly Fe transport n=1 Tax=Lishizhenia tianjinensis TaxID=477690 RepID=A0A1I6YWC6_9FLAO|nr:TonB-dependent receptor [Lishizhenia tianjinensis]SFT54762.1 Outer membrane receptor proteins, mostly Fe transport [Lishizhenia tianjinensis]
MKKGHALFLLAFLLGMTSFSFAQKFTISGSITDASNGEDLFGASVIVKELENTGASTNVYGFYSLSLPQGNYTLIYRAQGYDAVLKEIALDSNLTINVQLAVPSEVQEMEEVVIQAERDNANVTGAQMNVTTLDPKDIETLPVLFGEKDVMKTLQLTPGVKGAGEGNAGFYVRGGGTDQNLILLDESTVYNASHLLGFFSVFNSDAIKDVSLYKAGIPAKYGGRASSVMDVVMRDGNNKKFQASGGLGLISSRLTLEAPIVKEKGSFIVSGRRSYLDMFLKLSNDPQINSTSLYFYDLNAKANYKINDKNRVFLSGYFGKDVFGFAKEFGFDWGNATGTMRWNHVVNDKLFSNTSLVFSNFNYQFTIGQGDESFGVVSSIQDYNLKQDFSYFINKNNTMMFGFNAMHHTFKPGRLEASTDDFGFNQIELDPRKALEIGVYVQNEQKIGNRWSLMYGLRYSGFNLIGAGTAYEFDEVGDLIGQRQYKSGESMAYHQGLEPRFSASFILTESNSIKFGYNRNFQYIHQLSNATTSSPTDVYVPSSNNVKPQIADQVALGYYHNFRKNMYQTSVETYYKALGNQIDYRPGASLIFNELVEGELVYGDGQAYGVEFQLKKVKGKFTGWISYTLSRSLRQFDDINNGKKFSARQDRIHDISIVMMYKLNDKIALSGSFVYYTGDAVTFPYAKYEIEGYTVGYYEERNSYRMPDYHRLDLGLTWYFKERKKFDHNLNISVYNVYNRENAYAITFRENADTGATEAVQTTLFKIVPAVTYNFKFK